METDICGILAGCVFRVGDAEDLYLVESCRSLDSSSRVSLNLSGLSGGSIKKIIDTTDIDTAQVVRVKKEMFFTFREFCPLCSNPSAKSKVLFSVRQLFWNIEVRVCSVCGMAYKDPIANQMLLAHLYSYDYTHFLSKELDGDTLGINRSRVERLGKVRGRHLDYGCGAGHFVKAALLAGFDSYGADPFLPNSAASSYLRDRLMKLDATVPSSTLHVGKYDCISMWAVAEHLVSFKDTFAGLVSMLNPGGTIIFNSPNAQSLIAKYSGSSWRMATLIEHVQFCTPTAIKWLAEKYGLEVKKIRICGSPFPFGSGAGSSDQGLGSFPFSVPQIFDCDAEDGQSTAFVIQKSETFRETVMSRIVRYLLGSTGGRTYGATLIRQLIHSGHLGDHIEVTLKQK
jgi:hypothetical protein